MKIKLPEIRTVNVTRYVTPLREGGSLPAIVEADDDGMYVMKFRGAGQGPKALIAELIAGEIGRALGLPVPEIVFVELDPELGRAEPDFEIQALIKASAGLSDRLVRRLHDQRRSYAAQHQHAAVGAAHLADRSWGRALLSQHLGW